MKLVEQLDIEFAFPTRTLVIEPAAAEGDMRHTTILGTVAR